LLSAKSNKIEFLIFFSQIVLQENSTYFEEKVLTTNCVRFKVKNGQNCEAETAPNHKKGFTCLLILNLLYVITLRQK